MYSYRLGQNVTDVTPMRWPLALLAGLTAGVIITMLASSRPVVTPELYVKTICDLAAAEIDGASEQACGDAQDLTNIEYKNREG